MKGLLEITQKRIVLTGSAILMGIFLSCQNAWAQG
jgi:hypothetical protein